MALGVGLEAVFADNSADSSEIQTLRPGEIEPNKMQPRTNFDEASLKELADSIKEHGLIQPIIVRPMNNGLTYQIVAGERRWRACRMLNLNEIPVIIKEVTDIEMAQIALIENVQREDLDPIEEAGAYKQLIESYGMTQENAASVLGKSRSYITNSMRLLSLPEKAIDALKENKISVGHAKVLLSLDDEEMICAALDTVIGDSLSVRQTEKLVKNLSEHKEKQETSQSEEKKRVKNLYIETEIQLNEKLGRRTRVSGDVNGRGMLSVEFYNEDDLYKIAGGLAELFDSER